MKENIPPLTLPQQSPNGEAATAKAAVDPFDPAALRVSELADVAVEKVLTAVPVRRPKRTEFVRVHPDYVLDTWLLEREGEMDRQIYLVAPGVQHLLLEELRKSRLYVAIDKRGTVFIWPIKLPMDGNDRGRRISETALLGADYAKTAWVKVAWNRDLGGYEVARAKGDLGEPQWPDKSFRDLLEIAFRHYLIDRPDHDVIRELVGEL
jgi:hypothetical protein